MENLCPLYVMVSSGLKYLKIYKIISGLNLANCPNSGNHKVEETPVLILMILIKSMKYLGLPAQPGRLLTSLLPEEITVGSRNS